MSQRSVENSGSSPRLQSIDALRGFDMFWIMEGDSLAHSLCIWLGLRTLAVQFSHVKWHGFRFYDLIFPLFLFLVGVVLPFSLSKYTTGSTQGVSNRAVYWRILRRTLLLIALGLLGTDLFAFDLKKFRLLGVLQRIGICYFFSAIAVLRLRIKGQAILLATLLFGYWCLLLFVPAPGFKPYDLTMEGNLAGYLDRLLVPGRLYYGFGDNEGLLSTIPAICTTLLGALAGHWLRTSRPGYTKALGLYLAATVCLAAGYIWSIWFPLNKILWTSSFVLVTGGYSFALLATFYGIIDVWGYRKWAFFFIVIGANAITIYVLQDLVDFNAICRYLMSGMIESFGKLCAKSYGEAEVKAAQKALLMTGVIAVKWLLLWVLYRKKIFLRV